MEVEFLDKIKLFHCGNSRWSTQQHVKLKLDQSFGFSCWKIGEDYSENFVRNLGGEYLREEQFLLLERIL